MIRWGFVSCMVLLMTAVLLRFAPVAYADGCEGGDSTAGHNAIAFCCGDGNSQGQSRIISNHPNHSNNSNHRVR